jgi:hypothetical protein
MPDYEPGWGGLSLLFFWWKWRWVHEALGHTIADDACSCGMSWT